MSKFTNALLVSPLSDGKSWLIVGDFSYHVGLEDSEDVVEVEKGFVTDFASVPGMLWWVLPKWGIYGNATVIHDWLYWDQKRTRREADEIMLEAMGVLKVPKIKKALIFRAVRTFGGLAWKRNQWDKNSGFDRVVRDKNITYAIKLNRPGIFKRSIEQVKIA